MKYFLSLMLFSAASAAETPLAAFPVFLKLGFSSVLEFETAPTRLILGDATSFQVEKLDRSLIVRALVTSGMSNMFVYLTSGEVRLFTLTASEEAVPTNYKAFNKVVLTKPKPKPAFTYKKGVKLVSAKFDKKKDFLTVEITLTADSKEAFTPKWDWVDLRFGKEVFKPKSLWAERKIVQKDTTVKARFTFLRPNVSKSLSDTFLQIPVDEYASPIRLALKGGG